MPSLALFYTRELWCVCLSMCMCECVFMCVYVCVARVHTYGDVRIYCMSSYTCVHSVYLPVY